jgi:Na+-translocating ferredoxin:NAD+ oxidoreductase RnfE subunit
LIRSTLSNVKHASQASALMATGLLYVSLIKSAMTTEQKTLPLWILIVSGLFAVLAFLVSSSLCFTPASVLPNVDLHTKGVDYLIYMWAARQFSLGFIFGFATLRKSIPMLITAYAFFLVMNMGDFIIGIVVEDRSLYIGAGIMCLISSTMLYLINKR